MSIDIHGEIKMISNCDVDGEDELDSMASLKQISSLINIPGNKHVRSGSEELFSVTDNKENTKGSAGISGKSISYSTLPLRKHNSVTGPLHSSSPLRPNKRVHSVEIPVSALPDNKTLYQTDLEQGVAKLRVTPDEAREIMKFINDKISSRTSLQTPVETDRSRPIKVQPMKITPSKSCNVLRDPSEGNEETAAQRSQNPEERKVSDKDQQRFEGLPVEEAQTDHRLEEAQTDHRLEAEESVFGGRRVHRGFNSLPLLHRSADAAVHQIQETPSKTYDDTQELTPDISKPKLSLLSKLKKSLKLYSSEDKKASNIPQLRRPPSTYVGSEQSLNASSDHCNNSNHSDFQPAADRENTDLQHAGRENDEQCHRDYYQDIPSRDDRDVRDNMVPGYNARDNSTTRDHQNMEDRNYRSVENSYDRTVDNSYYQATNQGHRTMDSEQKDNRESFSPDYEHIDNRFQEPNQPPRKEENNQTLPHNPEPEETDRSRPTKRSGKKKGRSRSRSISKFFGNMARRAKSLTEVRRAQSPPWYGNDSDPVHQPEQYTTPQRNNSAQPEQYTTPQRHYSAQPTSLFPGNPDSAQPSSLFPGSPDSGYQQPESPKYQHTYPDSPQPQRRYPDSPQPKYKYPDSSHVDSPPIPRYSKPAKRSSTSPEKKRRSLVGRIKRKLSIGKGDKIVKTEKNKEVSKSTPTLANPPSSPAPIPKRANRAKSSENVSTSSSNTRSSTDVRTQIVLKSAKINKGCKCQVCSLVRQNIRSHCDTRDPAAHHKYEVVLKMNVLGADFMNSECGSVASYQLHHDVTAAGDSDREHPVSCGASIHEPDRESRDQSDPGGGHNQEEDNCCWNDESGSVCSSAGTENSAPTNEQLRHALSQARISAV